MMSFTFWMYLGLRAEPEKSVKKKIKKEIVVEDNLFRISSIKSKDITEEQITFYMQ